MRRFHRRTQLAARRQSRFLVGHNWWHLALHHLALGETAKALELHDSPIRGNAVSMLDLIDSSAMLWRLELARKTRRATLGTRLP